MTIIIVYKNKINNNMAFSIRRFNNIMQELHLFEVEPI